MTFSRPLLISCQVSRGGASRRLNWRWSESLVATTEFVRNNAKHKKHDANPCNCLWQLMLFNVKQTPMLSYLESSNKLKISPQRRNIFHIKNVTALWNSLYNLTVLILSWTLFVIGTFLLRMLLYFLLMFEVCILFLVSLFLFQIVSCSFSF